MKKKPLIIPMLLAAALLISACGQPKPEPQKVTFSLASNPTTGFSWQLVQSEELFDVESVYTAEKQSELVTGTGGTETFTLTAKKAGTTTVTLTYARPWEDGEQADQLVYTFEIDRNLQVKMTDAYSMGVNEPIATPVPEIG